MKTLTIDLQPTYSIYFRDDLLQEKTFADFLHARAEQLVIITDSHLKDTWAKKVQSYVQQHQLNAELLYFPAGEASKTRETKQALEDQLLAKYYGRDTCLIAVGGGVVTDMTGFIAATYCRGISAVYLPTSLLAMVDASIGGKTGVNTPFAKNRIGCFYQPKAVFIDENFLTSLPQAEFTNGFAEVMKHALILDEALFQTLGDTRHIIYRSCQIKKNIVEQDEHEQNLRQILNFGHTIGHAIEQCEHYRIRHGEAVAMGMWVESYLSMKMGFLKEAAFHKIIAAFKQYHLMFKTSAFQDLKQFQQALLLDKKAQAKNPKFVLLEKIGKVHTAQGQYSHAVPDNILQDALQWAKQNLT